MNLDAVGGRVATDAFDLRRVDFDRVNGGTETCALDGDRAATSADVPDQVADSRTELGEGHGSYFGLGDHAVTVLESGFIESPAIGGLSWGEGQAALTQIVAQYENHVGF